MSDESLSLKRDALLRTLSEYGRVVVAYSGGVDSAVVAQAAVFAGGKNAVAVTALSPSLASGELERAAEIAEQIGIRHVVIRTDEFANEDYLRNTGDRCFHCKEELYTQLIARRSELGDGVLCNGANLDDQDDHRPGMRAAAAYKVRSPLIDAGLNKADVRNLAREWGLPVWDKPATPCLSSRIAYGVEVTAERVQRVDRAEAYLREEFQIEELRVRCEANDLARIEVPIVHLPVLAGTDAQPQIVSTLRSLGFRYVTLDLEGFRSGSLNEVLPNVELEIPQAVQE